MTDNIQQPTSSTGGELQPPAFKEVRRYLHTIHQRETLGRFIKARWTTAELGEYARQMYLAPGRSYPTAASYQFAIEKGPEHPFAQETLATLRAPGYVMPPFDRPVPKRFEWDDPDSPDHTAEIRNDVATIARLYRNRQASWHALPRPDLDEPIPRWLWKRCYRLRHRYHSLEDTLRYQQLFGYSEDRLVPYA